jgi:hypothetical protein
MSLDIYDLKTIQVESKIIVNKLDMLSDRQKNTNKLLRDILIELIKLNTTVKNEPWTVVEKT